MVNTRWLNIAVVAMAVVLLALLLFDDVRFVQRVGGISSVVLLLVGWQVLRGRADSDRRSALALIIVVTIAAGVGTASYGSFAVVQCVAFTIAWLASDGFRKGLIANVILALTVGCGLLIASQGNADSLARTAITVGLSLALSTGIGIGFSRLYDVVAERDALITELRQAQEQVAALSRDAGVLDERERLAREIHDTIAQDLTGLVLTAQRGRRELKSGNVPAAAEQLSILEDNARSALVETRGLVAAGAPVGVEGGLTTALARLGERFERETGITVTVRAPGTANLDRDREVVLLRCAQEALANVRKHSGATAAAITVSTTHGSVVLRVSDNGRGFDPDAARTGFGLDGLRDRLVLAHGSLSLVSSPGKGAALIASLPGILTTEAAR